jgi:HlyD family secretion protein
LETWLKKLLVLLLLVVAGVIAWGLLRKSQPPKVNVALARRQTLLSTLPTNGKVEPFEWQAVRAESAGVVGALDVREGQNVRRGQVVARMSDPALLADVEAAQAKVAEARAALAGLEAGGKPAEITDIENRLARARYDLQEANSDYASLKRLAEKQAATKVEVEAALEKVKQTELDIEGLEKRRTSLVAKPDVAAAQARLEDTQSALTLALKRQEQSVLRAPISGVVYNLAARPGAYLDTGALVANVGQLDRLRVRVYVDEPELGRVRPGQPVTIRWQALPGKEWHGTVERKPAAVEALGSREVGEVVCTIENPGRELIPGTNVDAEIRTAVAENALVIPREALRHDATGDYVLTVKDGVLERCPVNTGISNVTQVQITSGLAGGDAVVLPSETPLKPGQRVTPQA